MGTEGPHKVGVSLFGSPPLSVDAPKRVATIYYDPSIGAGMNGNRGFEVGTVSVDSGDNATGASSSLFARDEATMPLLELALNVVPVGAVGFSVAGLSGELVLASNFLTANIGVKRSDELAVLPRNFVYFDETVDIDDGVPGPAGFYPEFRLPAGTLFNVASLDPWGNVRMDFARPGGGAIHGHIIPGVDVLYNESLSLGACGSFEIDIGSISFSSSFFSGSTGSLYRESLQLGCDYRYLGTRQHSFTIQGARQDFTLFADQVGLPGTGGPLPPPGGPLPTPGSLPLVGLAFAALALMRRRDARPRL
jgi:hypothetical protein